MKSIINYVANPFKIIFLRLQKNKDFELIKTIN